MKMKQLNKQNLNLISNQPINSFDRHSVSAYADIGF